MIPKLIRRLQVGLILVLFVCGGCLFLVLFFELNFFPRIYPGIKIANLDLGGKTQEEATQILRKASLNKDTLINLNFQDKKWQINLSDLDFTYLPESSSRKAYFVARTDNFYDNFWEKINSFRYGINLNYDYQLNQKLLKQKIAQVALEIDQPAVPPTIKIKTFPTSVEIQIGESGRQLDQKILIGLIHHHLGQLKELDLALPVSEVLPKISANQATITKKKAESLINKNLTLVFNENSWLIKDTELINFLNFTTDFEEEKIASFTAKLAGQIDQPAQNALFNFLPADEQGVNGRVVEFAPAKDGQVLDQLQTINLIKQNIKDLEKTDAKEAKIVLPVSLSPPQITLEKINNLGIKELIGKGESWFLGSIASRIHNIKLASGKLNGVLIVPQETFSFNQAVGDVSAKTGFQQAYIIKEGRTVLGDGGGVCQVSTTLFRAALKAGLPIVERKAHAYRVSYYEQNSQIGLDATVYYPSEDLKFINDTPAHILIQTIFDPKTMKLSFELYGTADGRKITISPSRIWDQTPPPADLYQDDPTLPIGTVKQIDFKAWGAKAAFDWKVERNGEVLQEKTFYSTYRPWQAIFLKGTAG